MGGKIKCPSFLCPSFPKELKEGLPLGNLNPPQKIKLNSLLIKALGRVKPTHNLGKQINLLRTPPNFSLALKLGKMGEFKPPKFSFLQIFGWNFNQETFTKFFFPLNPKLKECFPLLNKRGKFPPSFFGKEEV